MSMKINLKDYLLELSFLILLIRFLIMGTSISDAIVLITLVISIVYTKNYLRKEQKVVDETVYNEINDMKKKIDSLSMSFGLRRNDSKK